jgi:hypothetical protein
MPSCLVLESIIQGLVLESIIQGLVLESITQDLVSKGDNHHEDPMILFSLTSSRIDSIRTSQYLASFSIVIFPVKLERE